MMPAYNSFQLYKGDTLKFTITIGSSGSTYFIPNGSTFTGAVKERGRPGITAEFDASIVSASAGKVLFILESESSKLLNATKNWVYDIQLTDSGGVVNTLLTGNIYVTDEVSP